MKTLARIALLLVLIVALALAGCRQQPGATTVDATATPQAAPPATATPAAQPATATPLPPTNTPAAKEPYPPATLAAPATPQSATAYPGPTPEPQPTTSGIIWRPNGEIGQAEYRNERVIDNMALWWINDGEHLYMAMLAPTEGWVSVGFDPTNRMQGANFIMGAVVDGQPQIWDAFGMAPVGPNHPEDTALGGTMDVIAFGASEKDGQTLVEFQIPLDSGDQYDKPLVPGGTYSVIVAYGNADGFTSPHAYRGATTITLDPAP